MAWTNLASAFGYGTRLTSTQMQQLRENITALANGDSGAPPIQNASLASGISASKLSVNAGEVRFHDAANYTWYEVLGADGIWRQCSPSVYTGS